MKLANLANILPDKDLKKLPSLLEDFELTSRGSIVLFLATCAYESSGFTRTSENLNYSSKGLLITFPKYFNSVTALQYARKPQLIASRVYANRLGNGDEKSADGWLYRGRGYIQMTFKDNYITFDNYVMDDILALPGLVATKYPLEASLHYWKLNEVDKYTDLLKVSKKVNIGNATSKLEPHGMKGRTEWYNKINQLI